MANIDKYLAQVKEIVEPYNANLKIEVAKKGQVLSELQSAKQKLRQIKKEMTLEIEKHQITHKRNSLLNRILGRLFGGTGASLNRVARAGRDAEIIPYQHLKKEIDRLIGNLEGIEIQVKKITTQK